MPATDKKKGTTTQTPKEDILDVSSMLEPYEDKPIVPADEASAQETPSDETKTPARSPSRERTSRDEPLEERLKEDLKISYEAKGVLDITVGGYGFLRQNYAIDPQKDIYVSTSQIRRFWLRRG